MWSKNFSRHCKAVVNDEKKKNIFISLFFFCKTPNKNSVVGCTSTVKVGKLAHWKNKIKKKKSI
jgi:hypothetical protein